VHNVQSFSDALLSTFFQQQVAHFYNTIDQQMLASQQAMMLNSALAFEKLVKNPKSGIKIIELLSHLLSYTLYP